VPRFVRLLDGSESEDMREQAVWALGNIAGDGAASRDVVLDSGALAPLLRRLVPDASLGFIRNATWTLSNLCRGKPAPDFAMVRDALPTLAALINAQDRDVLTDALWALSYLSDGEADRLGATLAPGALPRIVELMAHHHTVVQTPALRTIANLITGDDQQTQQVLDAGALPRLLALMRHKNRSLRKEATWAVSNCMAGSREQIQAVLDAGITPTLVELLREGEFEIKKEACWAISSAISRGLPAQIDELVRLGALGPLAQMLKCEDERVAMAALEGCENVLRSGRAQAASAGDGDANGVVAPNPYMSACREAGVEGALLEARTDGNSDDPSLLASRAASILEEFFSADDNEPPGTILLPPDADGGSSADEEEGSALPPF
jgi:importin subunit alpha-1